ncbi:MAG: hypothetical protein QN147_14160, partial [Armatimonadota bacterium]|nr:hypothetical protein [Armatimonadota bacterium]
SRAARRGHADGAAGWTPPPGMRYDWGMRLPAILAMLAAAGCDARVKSAEGVTRASAAPTTPSRERESCAATADCEAPLRCVEGACRAPTSSRLGDYYWTAGVAAARQNDLDRATEAYQQAIGQFEAEKLPTPPALLCDYGAALGQRKNDPKAAEQAARYLHRCLLAAAPGSTVYATALAELVDLEPLGLDPGLLAREQPADAYLTRAPKKPATTSLRADVAQTAPSRDRGYAAWIEVVRAAAARGAFNRCYEDYWAATQKTALPVELQMKYRVTLGDDDVVVGARLDLGGGASAAGADAAASACVREALAGDVTSFSKDVKLSAGNWQGTIVVTLTPQN